MAIDQDSFNAQAYLDANPDVAASGIDPWSHYQAFGINENRALSAPASNPTQFNAQAYLAANPDVAASGIDPLYHYTMYGQNEGRQADFTYDADAAKYAEQLANANAQTELNKYQFSNTDNAPAKDIYDLKTSNPNLFYSKMADSLSNQIFNSYIGNNYGSSSSAQNLLESIKTENPTAYYNSKLGLLGQQEGWQQGQNTFGNAAGYQAEVNKIAPEALAAGLTADQINSLVGGGFSSASAQNKQRIASLPAGNSFWKDNLIGSAKVGAMALGAYGLDAALAAGATGMVDAAGNIIGGGLEGAAYGAGTAATQALPYTEAFDAYNMAQNGYNAATIGQNLTATGLDSFLASDMASLAAQGLSAEQIASTLAASYTPAELAGTGIESLNWGANAAQGLTAADALKYANQIKQGVSTASSLAKLLKPTSSLGAGSALSGAAQNLATGQTGVGSAIPALIRGNQNPFLQTAQQPIRSQSDLTSLANLLKQG